MPIRQRCLSFGASELLERVGGSGHGGAAPARTAAGRLRNDCGQVRAAGLLRARWDAPPGPGRALRQPAAPPSAGRAAFGGLAGSYRTGRKRRRRRLLATTKTAREGHGRAGDQRVEQAGGGQRQGGDVVGEGPEQVALDRRGASGGRGGSRRRRARRSPRDQGEVGASMATSVPVPMAMPRSAWASAGGVVDAVADHGHDAALAPAGARTTVDLVRRAAPRRPPRRCRPRPRPPGRRPRCRRSAAPGAGPSARSGATASALVGLTVSATTSSPRAAPSQPTSDRGPARRLGAPATASARPAASAQPQLGQQRGAGRRRPRGRRRRPRTPRPARFGEAATAGSAPPRARAAAAIGPRDRVLGGVLERAGQAQHLVAVRRPRRGRRRRAPSRPVVTVPVLSSTTVSTRRVDSSTSGPLIRMPSWAPRPVPTSSAVGVASPSAQGQAMISTATAAVKAALAPSPPTEPDRRASRRRAPMHGRHEHRRDAVGQPLHRRLARLRLADQPGDLGERGVGADARRRARPGGRRR